jgi:hypothetical protein
VAALLQAAAASKGVVRIDSFRDSLGAKREEFSASILMRNSSSVDGLGLGLGLGAGVQPSSSRAQLQSTLRAGGGGGGQAARGGGVRRSKETGGVRAVGEGVLGTL